MPAHPNDPRVLEQLRRMSGEERVRVAAEWFDAGHKIMAAGVRDTHPDWTEEAVRAEARRRCRLTRGDDGMPWP